jgi:hypothetical protein
MASKKERVYFQASVRGNGLEAACIVSATRVYIPNSSAETYVEYSIRDEDVSPALPDGHYQVSVNGEILQYVRRNGLWSAACNDR